MEYKTVGKTGIKVSNLCFGAMSFGGDADEEMSEKMFNECLEAGINFFDTADMYANGRSEEILGKLMKGKRDELVITSKIYYPASEAPDINGQGLSRKHIMTGVEKSLRRLQTDYIDFYLMHYFDENTDLELLLKTLDDLQREGKILYAGVSNWAAWQIMDGLGISEKELLSRFEIVEPLYNLVKRQAEVEILPMAKNKQLGVIPFSPLGGGLLTGKYQKKQSQGRLIENNINKKRYENDFDTANKFVAYANEHDIDPATLAVAWVASHPAVTAPIIGARNVDQLKSSLAAAEFKMTADMRNELDALSEAPVPANGKTEENAGVKFSTWNK